MRREKRTGIHHATHGAGEMVGLDRRRFLNQLGVAVLTVQCLAARDWYGATAGGPDDLRILSGPGAFSHEHELLIPLGLIKAPPRQGVRLTSSKALLHRHDISLTQTELTTVGRGGTVVQKASSHVFVIALAKPSPSNA